MIHDGYIDLYTKQLGSKNYVGVLLGSLEPNPVVPGAYISVGRFKAFPNAAASMVVNGDSQAYFENASGGSSIGVTGAGNVFIKGNVMMNGVIAPGGSFTTADGKTVTVDSGIITKIQ
jgi:hypothetical protein